MRAALLVDSEPPVSEILQEILKSEGMEAVMLASGSDAADCAQGQKFDVVFVDSSSPVSDGIELTPSFTTICPRAPRRPARKRTRTRGRHGPWGEFCVPQLWIRPHTRSACDAASALFVSRCSDLRCSAFFCLPACSRCTSTIEPSIALTLTSVIPLSPVRLISNE